MRNARTRGDWLLDKQGGSPWSGPLLSSCSPLGRSPCARRPAPVRRALTFYPVSCVLSTGRRAIRQRRICGLPSTQPRAAVPHARHTGKSACATWCIAQVREMPDRLETCPTACLGRTGWKPVLPSLLVAQDCILCRAQAGLGGRRRARPTVGKRRRGL
jgi:hypothetical protein